RREQVIQCIAGIADLRQDSDKPAANQRRSARKATNDSPSTKDRGRDPTDSVHNALSRLHQTAQRIVRSAAGLDEDGIERAAQLLKITCKVVLHDRRSISGVTSIVDLIDPLLNTLGTLLEQHS